MYEEIQYLLISHARNIIVLYNDRMVVIVVVFFYMVYTCILFS